MKQIYARKTLLLFGFFGSTCIVLCTFWHLRIFLKKYLFELRFSRFWPIYFSKLNKTLIKQSQETIVSLVTMVTFELNGFSAINIRVGD